MREHWAVSLGTLVGLALIVVMLANVDLAAIGRLLATAGWGIAAVIAFHLVQLLFSAMAWRAIMGPLPVGNGLAVLIMLRWIREGVNNLLPVAQIGGEVVAVQLLSRRGAPIAGALAGTVGDLTLEMLTQIGFTVAGLGLLILLVGGSGVVGYVASGIAVAGLGAACLIAAQFAGLAGWIERGIIRLSARFGWAPVGEIEGLDAAIRGIWRNPGRIARACLYHSISWLLGGIEVCLALHLLGTDIGVAEGTVIEALGQALKAAGFAIPGAIGVAEGGYVVVCHLFSLAPELAIALGLMKRLREIVLGLPALMTWRWLLRRPAGTLSNAT